MLVLGGLRRRSRRRRNHRYGAEGLELGESLGGGAEERVAVGDVLFAAAGEVDVVLGFVPGAAHLGLEMRIAGEDEERVGREEIGEGAEVVLVFVLESCSCSSFVLGARRTADIHGQDHDAVGVARGAAAW